MDVDGLLLSLSFEKTVREHLCLGRGVLRRWSRSGYLLSTLWQIGVLLLFQLSVWLQFWYATIVVNVDSQLRDRLKIHKTLLPRMTTIEVIILRLHYNLIRIQLKSIS